MSENDVTNGPLLLLRTTASLRSWIPPAGSKRAQVLVEGSAGATNVLDLSLAQAQTLVFVWLVFAGGQAAIYSTRRPRDFFWTTPHPGRWLMLATVFDVSVVTLMATQGWLMAPVSLPLVCGMLLLAIAFLVAADVLKVALGRSVAPSTTS